jgi:hypothetical protein
VSQELFSRVTLAILDQMPDAAPAGASTTADADRAVSYLEELSPQLRGCAILSAGGRALAASGEADDWGEAARELLAAADAAQSEPAAYVHVATGDGEVFCVREGDLVAVAVTERFVLASLMVFDLRSVLRDLAAGELPAPNDGEDG